MKGWKGGGGTKAKKITGSRSAYWLGTRIVDGERVAVCEGDQSIPPSYAPPMARKKSASVHAEAQYHLISVGGDTHCS